MNRLDAVLLLALCAAVAASAEEPNFEGRWEGESVNHPVRPKAKRVKVVREIGPLPTSNGACTPWKTTFTVVGQDTTVVRDHKLCRGEGGDEFYMLADEGKRLNARLLDGVLVLSFKANMVMLVSTIRVRDGVLEEETATAFDQGPSKELRTIDTNGLQKIKLRRVP